LLFITGLQLALPARELFFRRLQMLKSHGNLPRRFVANAMADSENRFQTIFFRLH
jgi:hypothetical protein